MDSRQIRQVQHKVQNGQGQVSTQLKTVTHKLRKRTDIQVNHSKTVIANGKTSCRRRRDALR